jgi:hypothetical protein
VPELPSIATFVLDAILHLVRFPLKALLMAIVVRLISRNEADVHRRNTIKITAVVLVLAFLLNTSPSGVLGVYPFCMIVLVTTLLMKKVFWIGIEKALIAGIVFVFLSVSLTDYTNRGMDRLIPGRPTIGGVLADLLDARTRKQIGDDSLPPSRRFMPALLRMAAGAETEGGIVHDLLSPFRTLQKAKTQIADIDQKARASASVVNMLSGAGTNVGSRAAEMQSLEQSLASDVQAGALRSGSAAVPAASGGFAGTQPYETSAAAPAAPPSAPADVVSPTRAVRPPAPAPAEVAGSADTFAEAAAKAILNLYYRLSGKAVPELAPETPRAPRAAAQLPVTQSAPPPPLPAAPVAGSAETQPVASLPEVEEVGAGVDEDTDAAVDEAASASPSPSVPDSEPPEDGQVTAVVTNLPGAAVTGALTNAPGTGGGISSTVAVAHADHVQYVPTPAGLKITGVVSRKDGSGFLTCNGRIVSVGGYVSTTTAEGEEVVLKLETITNSQPRWSLVVGAESMPVIPFGR